MHFQILICILVGTCSLVVLEWHMAVNQTGTSASQQRYEAPLTERTYKSIYFLKVFKTGSTTMYNMMGRVAIKHGLRWAPYQTRPYEVTDRIPNKQHIVSRIIPHFSSASTERFNILADHSAYNKETIEVVLSKPVSYITVLRHPVAHLRSFMVETGAYGMASNGHKKSNVDPVILLMNAIQAKGRSVNYFNLYSNPAARQLGFHAPPYVMQANEVARHLKEVDENFVVGLTEYFTTSIIIIRRKLQLSWRDIIYVRLRKTKYNKPKVNNDDDILPLVCKLSPMDCHIYDHFNKSFWQTVRTGGEDLQAEVQAFEEVLSKVSEYCSRIYVEIKRVNSSIHWQSIWNTESLKVLATKWSPSFPVAPKDCAVMRLEERALGNYFYFRQNWKACQNYRISKRGCPIHDANVKNLNCSKLCISSKTQFDLLNNLLQDKGAYIWF